MAENRSAYRRRVLKTIEFDRSAFNRARLALLMTPVQISEALALAREWKPTSFRNCVKVLSSPLTNTI
jgi:hypothetical protein